MRTRCKEHSGTRRIRNQIPGVDFKRQLDPDLVAPVGFGKAGPLRHMLGKGLEHGIATGEQEHSSQEIEAAVGRVSDVAKQISEALAEQITAVQEVASQMDNVRETTGENESSTKNMRESVESLIEEAGKLRDGVERFKV